MANITLKNIQKRFGDEEVIHGIDMEIDDGEFVILVGPSGCGKSTLLRMIAGLESITGGEVKIGDTVVNDMPPKARDIAMVFQSYALYPHMTVAENMGFALKLSKVDKAEVSKKVEAAAEILNLEPFLKRYPRELSGGQRQRVAMGRAIVRDPQVFLFDEPLSNLDAKLRVSMRTEIKELHQRLKTTTVYVTHDQIEAMTMADRIVVLHQGYVQQMGTPLELYDHPANLFVAGFIGSPGMNLIHGRPGSDGEFEVRGGGRLPLGELDVSTSPQTAVYGIRPEQITLADEGVPVQVVSVEPTGAEIHVVARLGDQHVTVVFRERHEIAPGDTIHLVLNLKQVHLFDADSGERVAWHPTPRAA
ncbi:ABC transporter ATP-binding protein [Aidingimonas halophila]|uniref:Carbohydrate ABC transporter ATP-binding protein, CUT1 family n=1 Tax=Aidingimonas halophila TaxID=574349 RepID=A0A1H2S4G0_9GAMM|nr:sn-glycerol-3-phosphate ABC transporter ATP-binding protein UgpC [Aidingimonas halophila]GHC18264.1 ABC transporter ATP-binding protein [Aidingimonas halophila]SDW26420.1 carbohydrate ABC transporter ATP-binding protein, CUT1 family [Aidingimonas halophila]